MRKRWRRVIWENRRALEDRGVFGNRGSSNHRRATHSFEKKYWSYRLVTRRVHSKRILPIGRIDKGNEIDLVWRQSSGGIRHQAPSIVRVAHLMLEEVSSHGAQCARALIKLI